MIPLDFGLSDKDNEVRVRCDMPRCGLMAGWSIRNGFICDAHYGTWILTALALDDTLSYSIRWDGRRQASGPQKQASTG